MKLYLVWSSESVCDDGIQGIFSTREKAIAVVVELYGYKEAVKSFERGMREDRPDPGAFIEELELDATVEA